MAKQIKEEEKKKLISEYFSNLAKQSHLKNPRSREFYQKMVAARKSKK